MIFPVHKNERKGSAPGALGLFFAVAVLLALSILPAGAENAAVKLSCHHVGVLAGNNKSAPVYAEPKTSSDQLLQMEKDEKCEVVGESGKFYRVLIREQIGFVAREKLKVTAEKRAENLPETLCDSVSLEDPIPLLGSKHLVLQGMLQAEWPMDTLYAYLWNERTYRVEQAYMKSLEAPAEAIRADRLKSFLPIGNVTGGRKTLVIQGSHNGEMVVLFRSPVYIRGAAEEPAHVTHLCGGLPAAVLDTKVSTAWAPTKKMPVMTVEIPEKARATLLTWEWKTLPASVTIELMDENGALLYSDLRTHAFFADWVALTPEVRRAVITPEGADCAMSTLRVYAEPYSRHAVQQWQEIPEKIDLLVVATHQDDELLFMGGAIPYYAHRDDVTVAVLYMADCGRIRCREGLDGLWTAGLQYHPIFLGLEDYYTMDINAAGNKWRKADPQNTLVRLIRRYRPEVILCQDINGEYGHGQHKLTTKMVSEAIQLAAREDYDPASISSWGLWQVKKEYIHLYGENQIKMDWTQPMDDSGIITPLFLATEAYDKHRSQQSYFSMHRHGVQYDNTLFGLYYSAVGPDVEKNDFMENVR